MAIFTNQASVSFNGVTVNSNTATGEITDALSIDKTALTEEYTVGESKTYIISIVNSCPTDITDVTVTDNLGAYEFNAQTLYPLTYEDGSLTAFVNGSVIETPAVTASPTLVISGLTVPATSGVLLIYSVRVNEFASPETDGEIVNTASLLSASYAPLEATQTVAAADRALLSISKSVSPQSVSGCDEVTFTFVIQNTGNTEAQNVILTDTFEIPVSITGVTLDGVALSETTDYTFDAATGVFTTVDGIITVPEAEFEQSETGEWITNPGSVTLKITANV